MLDLSLFASFLVATFVIVVTPGPSVALASSQAVRFGPRAAFLTVLGDALGSVVHIVVATAGMGLLIGYATAYLPLLQILGGVYIGWLGVASLRAPDPATETTDEAAPTGVVQALSSGFIACVSNPKAIIFFAALFPGFIDPERSVAVQSTIYGAIFVAADAFFIVLYALLAAYAFQTSLSRRLNVAQVSGVGLLVIAGLLIWRGIDALA